MKKAVKVIEIKEWIQKLTKNTAAKGIKYGNRLLGNYIDPIYWLGNTLIPMSLLVSEKVTSTIFTINSRATLDAIKLAGNVVATTSVIGQPTQISTLNLQLQTPVISPSFNISSTVPGLFKIDEKIFSDASLTLIYVLLAINLLEFLRRIIVTGATDYLNKHNTNYPKLNYALSVISSLLNIVALPLIIFTTLNHVILTQVSGSSIFSAKESKTFNEKTSAPPLNINTPVFSEIVDLLLSASGGVSGEFNVSLQEKNANAAEQAYILMIFSAMLLGASFVLLTLRCCLLHGPKVNLDACKKLGRKNDIELPVTMIPEEKLKKEKKSGFKFRL